MSRRDGRGQSHIPHNVPDETRREDRPPTAPLPRYPDPTMQPATPHVRSDPPRYSPYSIPPPGRPSASYPPEPSHSDPRHQVYPQRQMELQRSHDRGVVYPRQGEYYPPEGVPPAHQPAPRQRTAVACRYCRRRKIRCSGYQSSPDGRCTNCVQRDQKCEFLPVSASPYEVPRPEASYITPPQSTPQIPLGGHRPMPQYNIPPPPPPTYHLSPYASPHESRKRPPETELLSPPRKRQTVDPATSGKPNLAPIQTGASLRRRPTSQEIRSGYQDPRLGTPHSDYGQRSPPYSSAPSPQQRRESFYSSATTYPQPPPSAMLSSRSDVSPYTLLPPPQRPRSPVRTTPVHVRRYSYQPQTPYSPEQAYSARPTSQGGPHGPSPMSAAALPPPPMSFSRRSPIPGYRPVPPPRLPSSEYLDRPTISPGYEYGETTSLPPLAHLNRETPPVATTTTPAMPSPIPVSLPPPSGMITAPRGLRDTEILSAIEKVSDSPSRPPPRGTPSPDSARKQ